MESGRSAIRFTLIFLIFAHARSWPSPSSLLSRTARVLNFFPIPVSEECKAEDGRRAGICLNAYECKISSGTPHGPCALGFGVCCVFTTTCGAEVENNITYFVNPGFPSLTRSAQECKLKIKKMAPDITQIRLDFIHFNMGQPNRRTGVCNTDTFKVTGGSSRDINICGQNSGQHLYFDVENIKDPVEIALNLSQSDQYRIWEIKITQIEFNSRAPAGCNQYYQGEKGIIETLNYATNGRHLADQDYNICIRQEEIGIGKYKSFDGPVEKKPMDLQGISARVDKVNFDGVCRTKADILQHCVRDLFTANNFEDVIKKAHEAKAQMQAIGLFRSIAIYIDTSSGPNASRSGYEVTYQVTELKRFSGGVSKQFLNNEVFLAVGTVFPNILGNGEILKGEYGSGTKRTNTLGVTFSKPFFYAWNPVGSLSLFCNGSEFPMSGYKVQNTGCLFDLALSMKRFKHNFQYELDWKHIMADKYASFDVIQDVGHKLKSCIRHVATYESRDSSIFPSTGVRFRLTNEIAGLGGNIGLIKSEANFQYNCPLNSAVFQFALNAGHMFNFGRQFCLADNFFLGGPQTLRAFQTRGVGPSKNGNFVGGNVYYAAGLHLYTPLPFKPGATSFGENFRTHLWLNVGNVGDWNEKRFKELTILRMSAGLGIAVRLGQTAQLEFNLCYPILAQKTDKTISEHAQVGFDMCSIVYEPCDENSFKIGPPLALADEGSGAGPILSSPQNSPDQCEDKVVMACDTEDFIAPSGNGGLCDLLHCGNTFCSGNDGPCRIESSTKPFNIRVKFGPGTREESPEDNIGMCLKYEQQACT